MSNEILLKYPFAHRGLHNIKREIPENSLLAFSKAIKYGYAIELDIHLLQDNRIVIFHDDDLYRMTGKKGKIENFTYDEIKNLKLANTNQIIPLFKEALEVIKGQVPVIIELKNSGNSIKLEKLTGDILRHYKGEYAIKSFNPISIWYFKKHFPKVMRGQLVSDFKNVSMNWFKKQLLKKMVFNFLTEPDFISCDIKHLSDRKIQKIRKRKPVLGWVIKNQKDLTTASKLCDNIIFEEIKP